MSARFLAESKTSARSLLRAGDVIFILLFSCYVILFLALTLLAHATFSTGFDLAVYDNQVWNLSVGNLLRYSLINSVNFKDYSFDPLISMLIPLYAILPDARTLLIAATVALAVAAIPIYWYAKSQLGSLLALVVSLSYFISPEIQYVNLLNFHVIVLATPLLAFALFFLFRKRYVPFLVCSFLAMLAKEEVSLVITGFGFYLFIVQRRFKGGSALAIFGFVSLLVIIGYIFPYVIGKPYFHTEGRFAFSNYGSDVWQVLTALMARPGIVLDTLVSPVKLEFVAALLLPVGLIPLLGLEVLLTSLPFLLALLLSNPNHAAIQLQYPAALLPSLYFALIIGLHRIRIWLKGMSRDWARVKQQATDIALAVFLSIASIAGYLVNAPGPLAAHFNAAGYQINADTFASDHIFNQIPASAVVVAEEELLAHFSNRKSIYVFPSFPDYRLADYLITQRGRFFFNLHEQSWKELLSRGYFETVEDTGTLVLFKRRDAENPIHVQFEDSIAIVGYTLAPEGRWEGGKIVRPMVYWQARQRMNTRFSMVAEIADMRGHVWARDEHEPLDGVLPTTLWAVNQVVMEQYALKLPPTMPTGDYQLTISLHPVGVEDSVEALDATRNFLGPSPVIATHYVVKNKDSFAASQLDIERPLFADMDELRLLGYVGFSDHINPGDVLPVGIYWRARTKPARDYVIAVRLRDARGNVIAEQKDRPAMGSYSTREWDSGEVLLDWHDLEIPSTLPDGVYAVHVQVSDQATGLAVGEIALASVSAPK